MSLRLRRMIRPASTPRTLNVNIWYYFFVYALEKHSLINQELSFRNYTEASCYLFIFLCSFDKNFTWKNLYSHEYNVMMTSDDNRCFRMEHRVHLLLYKWFARKKERSHRRTNWACLFISFFHLYDYFYLNEWISCMSISMSSAVRFL